MPTALNPTISTWGSTSIGFGVSITKVFFDLQNDSKNPISQTFKKKRKLLEDRTGNSKTSGYSYLVQTTTSEKGAWMFTQTVEYALRAIVHLAQQSPAASTTEDVADATHVPRAYLAKILSGLRRSGLVKSQRGLGGGISLSRPPEELTILDVVNAVEPIERIKTCPLGLSEHGSNLCPLHSRMDMALALVESSFSSTTIADVLKEPTHSIPLCPFPPTENPTVPNRAWALNRSLEIERTKEAAKKKSTLKEKPGEKLQAKVKAKAKLKTRLKPRS